MLTENAQTSRDSSHLFTIRVWVESANHDTRQVRIQVKHVHSGAARTFLQWAQAIEFIQTRVEDDRSKSTMIEG